MDKEKLKEAAVAKYQADFIITPIHSTTAFEKGFDDGYDAARNEWHKIEEPRTVRIPHKETLLVTFEKFGAYIVAPAWFNEHRNQWFRGDTGEIPFNENLVAWRELPEPYQEPK